jgi:hypothetical protein
VAKKLPFTAVFPLAAILVASSVLAADMRAKPPVYKAPLTAPPVIVNVMLAIEMSYLTSGQQSVYNAFLLD